KLEVLRKEFREATRSAEEVRYEMSITSGQLRDAEDRVLKLEGEIRHSDVMLDTVREIIASDERELASISQRLQELQKNAAEKRAQAALLEDQISMLSQDLGKLEFDRSEAAEEAKKLTEAIEKKKM